MLTDATSVRFFRNYTLSWSIPGATRSKVPTEAVLTECSYTVLKFYFHLAPYSAMLVSLRINPIDVQMYNRCGMYCKCSSYTCVVEFKGLYCNQRDFILGGWCWSYNRILAVAFTQTCKHKLFIYANKPFVI